MLRTVGHCASMMLVVNSTVVLTRAEEMVTVVDGKAIELDGDRPAPRGCWAAPASKCRPEG